MKQTSLFLAGAIVLLAGAALPSSLDDEKKPDYPPFDKVIEGLDKVVSTADGSKPLYELYKDDETGRLLAVLPSSYDNQFLMVACTVTGGDPESGVMGPTHYVQWRKIGKRLALEAPNLQVRTEEDAQAKDSVGSLFTGRILLDVPILSMAPGNRPVIDLGDIATKKVSAFFGASPYGSYGPSLRALNPTLATLTKTKAFPKNVLVEYELPRADGHIVRVAYSIGELKGSPDFKPREADPRIGYFYDWYEDYSRTKQKDVIHRYITRWNLHKAEPKLRLSPPKEPITWYIEHTTPIRYRRYVREGIEMWNDAFEKVGFVDAVVVYQQDSGTGAHMDKDPEDARYNFFRWNTSDSGYAIGPSRTNPKTGEILDADVVWHQGLTRAVESMLTSLSVSLTESSFGPDTLAWFEEHPSWDPRVRMGSPAFQEQARLRHESHKAAVELELESPKHPWTMGSNDPTNQACRIGTQLSMDLSLGAAALKAGMLEADEDGEQIDGLPEEFIGAMIRYISAHEVGHTMGLQHNMAASTIRSLEEINSPGYEGPTIGSVMDYCAVNINHECGEVQGAYATPSVGPYDDWAIAFGYGDEKDLKDVLAKVSEPDHIFISQMAMSVGSDPRNMTWDVGANSLEFAESRLSLVAELRSKLLEELVDEGESWSEARHRHRTLLGTQLMAMNIVRPWIGGSFENYDFKGDPGNRPPIEDVPAAEQRRALKLIIDNAFEDSAYGLTPEIVRHLGKEYWWDPTGMEELMDDPNYTVHDDVGMVQAVALTFVMNPSMLRRVYDNEYRTAGQADAFTLAEELTTVTDAAWREYAKGGGSGYSATNPMCSSFRRNLQAEHLRRLIDLTLLPRTTSPSVRAITTLATQELRRIDEMAAACQKKNLDPYTKAHLADVRARIEKALNAIYVVGR